MASQAEDETKRQMAAIISEEAASYILDKADALACSWRCRWSWMRSCCPVGSGCKERLPPMPGAS